jgi:hypothetical protein
LSLPLNDFGSLQQHSSLAEHLLPHLRAKGAQQLDGLALRATALASQPGVSLGSAKAPAGKASGAHVQALARMSRETA